MLSLIHPFFAFPNATVINQTLKYPVCINRGIIRNINLSVFIPIVISIHPMIFIPLKLELKAEHPFPQRKVVIAAMQRDVKQACYGFNSPSLSLNNRLERIFTENIKLN